MGSGGLLLSKGESTIALAVRLGVPADAGAKAVRLSGAIGKGSNVMSRRPAMVLVVLASVLAAGEGNAWGQVRYVVTDLGTLGGSSSQAFGIDASGQVVGDVETASGAEHAFLYSSGAMQDLGTLPGGSYSVAIGINNSGRVVGQTDATNGDNCAFLFSAGRCGNCLDWAEPTPPLSESTTTGGSSAKVIPAAATRTPSFTAMELC